MKLMVCFFSMLLYCKGSFAQEIVNLVLVGNSGITEDVTKAHSFIVVKQYPGFFQRLDYVIGAPLQKLKTYSDSSLSILHGDYYEYDAKGNMKVRGNYENNARENEWYFYNDTGKIIRYETYMKDVLIKTTDPDTLKKEEKTDKISTVELEAEFGKGQKGWIKYLIGNLRSELSLQSVNGGAVWVEFVVNTEGKCTNVHLFKSVEFVLDEEAIRVIEKSPSWKAAVQNGKKVNAYRRQPISFVKP